jgi:hypothetical protein
VGVRTKLSIWKIANTEKSNEQSGRMVENVDVF